MELKEYNSQNVETDDDCFILVTSKACAACSTAKKMIKSIEDCDRVVHVALAADVPDVIKRARLLTAPSLVYKAYGVDQYASINKFGKKEIVKFLGETIGYTEEQKE